MLKVGFKIVPLNKTHQYNQRDMKLMRGMHGKDSPDSNRKSKMPCYNLFSKREKTEELLLQGGMTDTEDVRRDSG